MFLYEKQKKCFENKEHHCSNQLEKNARASAAGVHCPSVKDPAHLKGQRKNTRNRTSVAGCSAEEGALRCSTDTERGRTLQRVGTQPAAHSTPSPHIPSLGLIQSWKQAAWRDTVLQRFPVPLPDPKSQYVPCARTGGCYPCPKLTASKSSNYYEPGNY